MPFKAGDTWAFDRPSASVGTYTVVGVEQIKVPAGTFEAEKVNIEYATSGVRKAIRAWYAPNVGRVRMADADGKTIWLLKSFTPGRD